MMRSRLTDCGLPGIAQIPFGVLDRPDEGWQILTQS